MSTKDKIVRYLVRGCLVIVVACVVVSLVAGGAALLSEVYQARKAAAPFESMEAEAKAACAQCFQAGAPVGVRQHRRGKVLVVESDTGKANGRVLWELPAEIRAATPEEIGTLVCVGAKQQERVGSYEDGAAAYRNHRQVCACLWPEQSPVLLRTVQGSSPPKAKTGRGRSASGGDPLPYEIASFIEALPAE
ncbi:MAG: hypothetical protein ACUVXG_11080 [Anaerolineae bacterium]